MKVKERNKAVELRKKGISMGEISRVLNVAKSSVSYWVRDIELTKSQRKKLNKSGHSVDAIEKRRIARVSKTREKREFIMREAASQVRFLSKDPLWCIGVALYWGEGGKTQQTARLANSDPLVIKIMMHFFRETCQIDEIKLRGHIHTFSKNNADKALKYWSNISGISEKNFFKTYVKKSIASKNKRKTLPYGTFQVYVHDSVFFFRIMGWIRGVSELFEAAELSNERKII